MEDKNLNIEEVLKSAFETIYQEYKSYETFMGKLEEKTKKGRDEYPQFVQDNIGDVDKIVNKLVEINDAPVCHGNDFMRLKFRLLYSYDLIKGIVEIPQEIKTEIENSRPKQLFKIENGEAVVLDQDLLDKIREKTKEGSREFLNKLISDINNK